jgi:GntR family transcriptional regulator/MocR family aminotransferase
MLDHLIINLDPEGDASLQAQLRQSVVEAILSRAILPGDKLPSSRALADQLGISRNTVVLAYQALIDTGFIEAREGRAMWSAARPPSAISNHRWLTRHRPYQGAR